MALLIYAVSGDNGGSGGNPQSKTRRKVGLPTASGRSDWRRPLPARPTEPLFYHIAGGHFRFLASGRVFDRGACPHSKKGLAASDRLGVWTGGCGRVGNQSFQRSDLASPRGQLSRRSVRRRTPS